jgi:hypothetical protein
MKMKMVSIFLLALTLMHAHIRAEGDSPLSNGVTFEIPANTSLVISCQSNCTDCAIDNCGEEMLTRKKHHSSLSSLFQGLAQSCNHLNTALNAQTKQEKQQAILHIFETVLTTAAQATSSSKADGQPATTREEPASDLSAHLTLLTTLLLEEYEQEQLKSPDLSPLLAHIKALTTTAAREAFIQSILASPQQTHQFLDELFTFLTSYLSRKIPDFTQLIKDYIIKHWCAPA